MNETKFFIRLADEPTFKDRGIPQSEYRTEEHWAQVYVQNGEYHVEFGNCRGTIEDKRADRDTCLEKFQEYVASFGMEQDSWKDIQQENENLSLEQIVKCFFIEGDILNDMDEWLDRLKTDAHLIYRYKNLYTSNNGFLAQVKIWRFATQKYPLQKLVVFILNDGIGHMVKRIERA